MIPPSPARRVVITGMGVIAPNGSDLKTFWGSIIRGESAAAPVTRFDASSMPTRIACEVKDFNPKLYVEHKKARHMELCTMYSVAAARLAVDDADVDFRKLDPDRAGVIEGVSSTGVETMVDHLPDFMARGMAGIGPHTMLNGYNGTGCSEIALALGIKGHTISIGTGSASGNDVIGSAWRMIRDDELDILVVGASEAPLQPIVWASYCVTRAMTRRNSEPKSSMRPWDKSRDGFVLGEGAGYLVVEELSHALSRKAKIYAEVVGHGRSCDAYHSITPQPEGVGVHRAMEKALRAARMDVSEIDYINIHGTGTHANDAVEIIAIRKLLGDHAPQVAISGTKPVTGHMTAASGAVEAIVCALSLKNSEIPFTLNLTDPEDPNVGSLVMGSSRRYPIRTAMNLNSGFGGKNACLILKEYRRQV